jgi:hypothetical protein
MPTFPELGTPTPLHIENHPVIILVPCSLLLYILFVLFADMEAQPLVPDIEDNIPLPAHSREAFPELSVPEEIEMRARTIKLISDITQTPIIPTDEDADAAQSLAREMVENPEKKPDFSIYPNEVIAMYAGIAARYNHMIVKDLAELKLYVVNKLFETVEAADDPKTRVSALKALGEVDGIDAFKRRTETTHIIKPIEEVEKELLQVLEGIEYKVIEDDKSEITQHAE